MRTNNNKKNKRVSSDACTLGTLGICPAARPHGEIQSRLSRGTKVFICMCGITAASGDAPPPDSMACRSRLRTRDERRDSHLGVFAVHREGCVFNQW